MSMTGGGLHHRHSEAVPPKEKPFRRGPAAHWGQVGHSPSCAESGTLRIWDVTLSQSDYP